MMGSLFAIFMLTSCVSTANRDQSVARTRLGTAYLREQNIPGAIGILQEATKLDPRNAEAWEKLALAYMAHGALEESGDAFENAVKLAPDQAEVRNHYGLYLMRVNQVPEAIEQFEAARADFTYRNPAMILNNLGQALLMEGRHDEAIVRLSEAISRSPNLCQPRINRGRAWQLSENSDKALTDYEAAIQLCEGSDVALYYSGSLLLEMGHDANGCSNLEEARTLNPDSEIADRANDLFVRECD